MHFVCANPKCRTVFVPYEGGRFFRFQRTLRDGPACNSHGVKHYWLCARCCERYAVVEEPMRGIEVRERGIPFRMARSASAA